MKKQRIVFTVTNDLNFDQRMIRICTTLSEAGYDVTIIGFKKKKSPPLIARPYKQIRLPIVVERSKLMYTDFWLKLFFKLLFIKADIFCAIDLDTILPVYYVSKLRGKKRVYDAHELFTELKEVTDKPMSLKIWNWIERKTVPHFHGYTVGDGCSKYFQEKYGVNYAVVRSATVLRPIEIPEKKDKYILYQGAVNVGRCFEELIPAMKHVDAPLIICGEGNFYKETVALVKQHQLENKITFKGYVPPQELRNYTINAWIGITLFEPNSKSNQNSLANRFFDYMHSGVPQLCVNYFEYKRINSEFEISALIDDLKPETIAAALNNLLKDEPYHKRLEENCLKAREKYCWQEEAKTLIKFYDDLVQN
ncbi:MAG TPA: glycosyltransferase [Flavipsychrobacter sp.]|nr:glycosyltransferase [Flavipsychrobacter sp.]